MSIFVILECRSQPGRSAESVEILREILPDTRTFPGCESVALREAADDQETLLLCEIWSSREDHEKYRAWRSERGDLTRLLETLAGPPTVRYFTDLDA